LTNVGREVLFHLDVPERLDSSIFNGLWFTYLLRVDDIGAETIQGCARRHLENGMGPCVSLTPCRPFSARRIGGLPAAAND